MSTQQITCFCCHSPLARGVFTDSKVESFWALCKPCTQEFVRKNIYLTITGQSTPLIHSYVDEGMLQEVCSKGGIS